MPSGSDYTRRKFVAGVSALTVSGIAGCSGSNDPNVSSQSDPVKPSVSKATYPSGRTVSLDYTNNSSGSGEFSLEMENTGSAGSIDYTLVWLDNAGDDVRGDNSTVERTHTRYFSAGERRTVTMTAAIPDYAGGYGFRFSAAEVDVTVENSGGKGKVNVELLNGSSVVSQSELTMEADESTTVNFTPNFVDAESFSVDTEVEAV